MSKDILSVENITMQFGGVVAVNNLSLHIPCLLYTSPSPRDTR